MSTRSLPMRTRFFFSPRCCWAFSSRSLRFSSLVFFFGRVFWFRASRSILPWIFNCGALLSIFFSLFNWNTCTSGFSSCSAGASSSVSSVSSASSKSSSGSDSRMGSVFWMGVSSTTSCSTTGSSFGATGSSFFSGVSGLGLTAAAFSSTTVFSSGATDLVSFVSVGSVVERLPTVERSIFPTVLNCGRDVDESNDSARISLGSATGFFSLGFFWNSCAACERTSLSCWKASTRASYCSSLIFDVSSSFSSPRSFLFERNSTAVWSPMFSSLIALFNLMLILLFL